MKKFGAVAIIGCLVLSLASCGSSSSKAEKLVQTYCKDLLPDSEADLRPLSEATRLDSKWIPMAQAASFMNGYGNDINITLGKSDWTLEYAKDKSLIFGICLADRKPLP